MISLKMFDSSQIDRGLLRIKVKGSIIIYDNFPLSQKSVTSGSNRKCSKFNTVNKPQKGSSWARLISMFLFNRAHSANV